MVFQRSRVYPEIHRFREWRGRSYRPREAQGPWANHQWGTMPNEASLMDTLLLQIVLLHEERVSKLGTTLREELSPELQTVDVIGSSIIAANVDVGLAGLDPAVWRAAAVGFLEDSGPILDGAEEVADVNEVKGVVVPCPAEGGVVDLKFNIGRDPAVDVPTSSTF
ncbi:hypothetical protein HG530_010666 [Fusarium avenaceum]|nr:hypothetical protein HG530_010666 [Fusarium avenaceum]